MSLLSTAQIIEVMEVPAVSEFPRIIETPAFEISSEDHIKPEEVNIEISEEPEEDVEVSEENGLEGDIIDILDFPSDLPGAPPGTEHPIVTPSQEQEEIEVSDKDDNEVKEKKNDKWDWSSKGADGFVIWIKERFDSVPKHSGFDSAGLERAQSYLEKLDNEISKAMRLDLEGELDANKVEEIRSKIDDGISKLQDRLDKVKKVKRQKRKKTSELNNGIVKEGQKITGVSGIVITVPLLISRIARVCINGSISAGHSIEDLFKRQAEKYKLNDREKVEVIQLLFDMGYPIRNDRGFMLDEDIDPTSPDNFDWQSNYGA